MKRYGYICSADIGSVTEAMKAQKMLAAAAIPSEIIKNDRNARGRGCIFGIEFSCSQKNNVRTVLDAARIRPKAWKDENDLS